MPQLRNPARYHILGEHGRGGLGKVSRAHDIELGRDVAIKELLSRSAMHEVRFMREALITARLEHPGIVPVHEAGRWPDGTPFYAMKLVAGRPLRDLLAERKTVDERLALLHHVIAVAEAIAYAHGRRIIHRDLKPGNVIIGDFGETVVIDWGLAKDLSGSEESTTGGGSLPLSHDDGLTSAGAVLGTPAYMAPEQRRGEPVDQRADVYAIGAMLWELCSLEKLPLNYSDERHRILRKSGIDRDLITIVEKAIAPDPARRYADAGALAADLKAFKAGGRIGARQYSSWAILARWVSRHRGLALSICAAVALVLIGATLYVHTIALERDRAEAAQVSAQLERDRAQLAEASLLLEKDPTSAKQLLDSLPVHTPQRALLLARARATAAIAVFRLPGLGLAILGPTADSVVAVVSSSAKISLLSPELTTGTLRRIDDDLRGPAAVSEQGSWLYARRRPHDPNVSLVDSGSNRHIDIGTRMTDLTGQIITALGQIYMLDNHLLYKIEQGIVTQVATRIQSAAGSRYLLAMCSEDGFLTITPGDSEPPTHCVHDQGKHPIAVTDHDYAVLTDPDTVMLVREGRRQFVRTHIRGVYAISLSTSGLLTLADTEGGAWFVAPNSDRLESAPDQTGRPTATCAYGDLAAWGYADGKVIVEDITKNTTWEFKGHSTSISELAIDHRTKRLFSIGGNELRIWSLTSPQTTALGKFRSKIFNVVVSLDHRSAALAGSDGTLRLWSFEDDSIRELHHHNNTALGIAWWRDQACSGSFDGSVMCSTTDGHTTDVLRGTNSVRWLIVNGDHTRLLISTADGTVRDYDNKLRTLFRHDALPYRMAFDPTDRHMASVATDGSLILYSYSSSSIISNVKAHRDFVTNAVWNSSDLWTASSDGDIKRWHLGTTRSELSLISTIHESGSVRFFNLTQDGWIANVDERYFVASVPAEQVYLRLDIGKRVSRMDISPDSRYVAILVPNEVTVVDLKHWQVSVLPVNSDGTSYCGFVKPDTLTVTTGISMYNISIKDMPTFSPFF